MSTESNQETVLLHLPSEIITNILLRLPVRSILCCKCVCKQFLEIISTYEFATSHYYASTTPGLVIHQYQEDSLFKLLEYEDTLKLQSQHLRDLKVMQLEPSTFMGATSAIGCWGSVDGFLCLGHFNHIEPVYICNPITREVIHIPRPKLAVETSKYTMSGFGISELSGQYKVVVNYNLDTFNECLVYTLGTTGSWRSVAPDASFGFDYYQTGLFMNGNIHWMVTDEVSDNGPNPMISCFDLETERFKYISPPPDWEGWLDGARLIILEDCLCLCQGDSESAYIVFWVMTEYGIENSWTREFEICKFLLTDRLGWFDRVVFPVEFFEDGGILFSSEYSALFYYCDERESTRSVKVFKDHRRVYSDGRGIETITHTFSFLSLKSFGVENVMSF